MAFMQCLEGIFMDKDGQKAVERGHSKWRET